MPLARFEKVADRRRRSWRGIVIAFAVAALSVSLATRGSHVRFDLNPVAHDNSSFAKVQHRDTDAFEWVSPAPSVSLLWVTTPSALIDFDEPIHFRVLDDSLYNRPPPAL